MTGIGSACGLQKLGDLPDLQAVLRRRQDLLAVQPPDSFGGPIRDAVQEQSIARVGSLLGRDDLVVRLDPPGLPRDQRLGIVLRGLGQGPRPPAC